MSEEIGQLEIEYFTPPCEICFVCTQIEYIEQEETGITQQWKKESLKSQFCDPCYDYFYDKIQIHEGIEE